MASNIVKHNILVRGQPTEILTLGETYGEKPQNLILVITGNPGVPSYYRSFMESMYQGVKETHSVWAMSHAGHCRYPNITMWPDSQKVYNLEEQVEHKIAFLEDHLPKGTKLTLVGHSIGTHIILRILKYFQARSDISIVHNYLLFPTFERLIDSPNGQRFWLLFYYLRWLIIFLSGCVYLLPEAIKAKILRWYFGTGVASCSVNATSELIHPQLVQNALWMAYNELEQVHEPDLDTINKHKESITLYYGATDGWVPTSYKDDLQQHVKGVDAHLCDKGFKHAFVLTNSQPVGELMVHLIKVKDTK